MPLSTNKEFRTGKSDEVLALTWLMGGRAGSRLRWVWFTGCSLLMVLYQAWILHFLKTSHFLSPLFKGRFHHLLEKPPFQWSLSVLRVCFGLCWSAQFPSTTVIRNADHGFQNGMVQTFSAGWKDGSHTLHVHLCRIQLLLLTSWDIPHS